MATIKQDLDKVLDSFSRRLQSVEQRLTSPGTIGGSTGDFEDLYIGPAGNQTYVWGTVSAPTNLVLTWGSFFDVIFVDASWSPPADNSAVAYQVDFAKKVGTSYQIARTQRVISTTVRIEPVQPDTTYAVRVSALNRINRESAPTPWVEVTTGHDASVPPIVTGVVAEAGFRSAVVKWSEADQPVDVAGGAGLFEAQISISSTFSSVLDARRISGTIIGFDNLTTSTTYYFRVSAIDSSSNQGPWSAIVNATTARAGTVDISDNAITAEKIVAGSISSDKIVTAGLDAAVIKFGTMSGDRITANTLDVQTIKTSTLTARDITLGAAGQLKAGNPPTTGLLINDQGLSLYSGGTRSVFLDAITGAGSFTGTISGSTITSPNISGGTITGALLRTDVTGRRIEISSSAETFLGVTANNIKLIVLRDNGSEPFEPGRIYNQKLSDTDNALQIRSGRMISTADTGILSLNSYGSGDAVASISASIARFKAQYVGSVAECRVQGAPLFVEQGMALSDQVLYIRGFGDTNHLIHWNSFPDGPEITGAAGLWLRTIGAWDVAEVIGWGGGTVRSVNSANTAYRDHVANTHINISDMSVKHDIKSALPAECLNKVKKQRPFTFRSKRGWGDDGKQFKYGISANDAPIEVQYEVHMDEGPNLMGLDPAACIALLWGAVGDLAEQVANLSPKLPA